MNLIHEVLPYSDEEHDVFGGAALCACAQSSSRSIVMNETYYSRCM